MEPKQLGATEQSERVGPYRLEERLGAGGMGAVWRGWDERLKRPVALKRILLEGSSNPSLRERFRREAQAEARLNHPSIIQIYDILDTEGCDWIVMELVHGDTIRNLLKKGPFDPLTAARLGCEVAEGLAEAHAHGIIHRDLKASNVMVTPAGRAKILDFGIAKQVVHDEQDPTLSRTGVIVGTYHAMSPEQAMGLPLDGRSDLFSLGSLLYEMVTAEAPFLADTPTSTLARVCSFRQPSPRGLRPDLPPALSSLIDRLLEKDPDRRPQSAEEVAAALRAAAAQPGEDAGGERSASDLETLFDLPPDARTTPPTPPEARRSLSRTAIALAVLLPSLALGLLSALRNTAPEDPYVLYQHGLTALARYDKGGNLDEAIEDFRSILTRDDRSAPACAGLAKAYWHKYWGENQDRMWLTQALPVAKRAVELDEYLAVARVSLGLVYSSMGRLEEGKRELETALLLEPANADAHYGLARIHEAHGSIQEAEAAYKKAIASRPDRMFHDELGTLYLKAGRLDEAVASYRHSIQLAPDSIFGYRNLGAAYYSQGKLDEAAAQFQKALQIQPHPTLYTNLGTLYFAQGRYQESIRVFEKALETPGGANNYQLWGNLADAYRLTPDNGEKARDAYLRGIQLLRERLQSAPQDGTLRSRLALYLAKRGDRNEALAEIREVEKLPEQGSYTWFRAVVVHEICGERERALAALARALQAGVSLSTVQEEPDLVDLRGDVRYHRMIASAGPR